MAYPPAPTYPIQQSSQYQPSLLTNYPTDQYPQQGFSHQSQTSSPPDSLSHDPSVHQNFHQQDSYPQSFQHISHSNSFPQPFTQNGSQVQQNPPIQPPQLYPQLMQQQRQQYSQPSNQQPQQQQQQFPQQIQQPHAQFPQQHSLASYSLQHNQPLQLGPSEESQYAQSSSPIHQATYTQQNQQSPYAPLDRFELQSSPVQLDPYPPFNQTVPPSGHPQESSLAQSGQFSSQGIQPLSAFPQQSRQHQYSSFPPPQPIQQAQQRSPSQPTLPISPSSMSQPPNPSRSQTIPYQSQQQLRPRQERISRTQPQPSPGSVAGTYQLFFTGRDDPRGCMLIGEDTKPVHLAFETQENNLGQSVQTLVYRNNKDLCAVLDWGTGGFLGNAKIGPRQIPMSQLVVPGSMNNARGFTSSEGVRFEWRRMREDMASYDLYMVPDTRIALFRKYYNHNTPIGPTHALIQYTFSKDVLLLEALISLLLNRWIDMHGIQFSP